MELQFYAESLKTLAIRLNMTLDYITGEAVAGRQMFNYNDVFMANPASYFENGQADVSKYPTHLLTALNLTDPDSYAFSIPYLEAYEITAIVPKKPIGKSPFGFMWTFSGFIWAFLAVALFVFVLLHQMLNRFKDAKSTYLGSFTTFLQLTLCQSASMKNLLFYY